MCVTFLRRLVVVAVGLLTAGLGAGCGVLSEAEFALGKLGEMQATLSRFEKSVSEVASSEPHWRSVVERNSRLLADDFPDYANAVTNAVGLGGDLAAEQIEQRVRSIIQQAEDSTDEARAEVLRSERTGQAAKIPSILKRLRNSAPVLPPPLVLGAFSKDVHLRLGADGRPEPVDAGTSPQLASARNPDTPISFQGARLTDDSSGTVRLTATCRLRSSSAPGHRPPVQGELLRPAFPVELSVQSPTAFSVPFAQVLRHVLPGDDRIVYEFRGPGGFHARREQNIVWEPARKRQSANRVDLLVTTVGDDKEAIGEVAYVLLNRGRVVAEWKPHGYGTAWTKGDVRDYGWEKMNEAVLPGDDFELRVTLTGHKWVFPRKPAVRPQGEIRAFLAEGDGVMPRESLKDYATRTKQDADRLAREFEAEPVAVPTGGVSWAVDVQLVFGWADAADGSVERVAPPTDLRSRLHTIDTERGGTRTEVKKADAAGLTGVLQSVVYTFRWVGGKPLE